MMTVGSTDQLPKLLYFGDVPVRPTAAGSALLYRLLTGYSPGKLKVWETNRMPPTGPKLDGVQYTTLNACWLRLLRTRLSGWYGRRLLKHAGALGKSLAEQLAHESWKPEAVLTVAHGHSWLAAAEMADRLGIPLHLIVHDEVHLVAGAGGLPAEEFDQLFGKVYRQAGSRLCVSPFMAERYTAEFGAAGTVLYPSRAAGAPEFTEPPERLGTNSGPLTFAYGGSLSAPGYSQLLARFARVAQSGGHRVLIYSNLSPDQAAAHNLNAENVTLSGMIPFAELIQQLRDHVDVLLVPMSFDPADRPNMELSFPSKLTDYTAVGLPLLILGPPYCSAVRWAKANPGVAEVVTEMDDATLKNAIDHLSHSDIRQHLAESAIAVGREFFSHHKVVDIFFSNLLTDSNNKVVAPAGVRSAIAV